MLENFFLWGKSQISGLFLSRRNLTNANWRGTPLILALFLFVVTGFPQNGGTARKMAEGASKFGAFWVST